MNLIHSEKMASLGQLVAGIAHEINTPSSAISAAVFNLADDLGRCPPGCGCSSTRSRTLPAPSRSSRSSPAR